MHQAVLLRNDEKAQETGETEMYDILIGSKGPSQDSSPHKLTNMILSTTGISSAGKQPNRLN